MTTEVQSGREPSLRSSTTSSPSEPVLVEPATKDDSIALGRQARTRASRSSHAEFEPGAGRPDPVEILERQAATREPELVPIRYGRMLVSPFSFFRGAAAIMASDLAATTASGIDVQCCGDAHLSNFGLFASPERRLVFDLNDFDETHVAPWEWDVKRLAVSMLIAAQSNGFGKREQRRTVLACLAAYRRAMTEFASLGTLEVWYSHIEVDALLKRFGSQLHPRAVRRTEKALTRARTRDSMQALSKLTERVDGRVAIVDRSPLIVPIEKLEPDNRDEWIELLRRMFLQYRDSLPAERRVLIDRFRLVDFARKVVGVGSVGTRAWIALLVGPDGREPLFLQIKQAEASVLEPHTQASEFDNHGQRVVVGQRLMQATSDIFLGWLRVTRPGVEDRDFYVRQLRDWKGSAEIERMIPEGMAAYGRLCGWTLARAHARSGDRFAIASYLGTSDRFDRAILSFASVYAEQNQRDYEALSQAASDGRVRALRGL